MSFYGHVICTTLIRCHFSPGVCTNKRYLYTASSDGIIYIYDIYRNKLVAILDNQQ